MIGDDIILTVLGSSGGNAKLGIDAPDSISVLRKELYLKQQAASDTKDSEN